MYIQGHNLLKRQILVIIVLCVGLSIKKNTYIYRYNCV